MRRLVITLSLILIGGRAGAFAQSDEDLLRAKLADVEASLAQLNPAPAPFKANVFPGQKSKTGATEALQTGLQGAWWREATWVKSLALTPDQQKKMDDAFLQNRIRLIDLTAALEKEEVILEPLVENVRPADEAKILAQIDKVADARAGLEKANARMLLAIRETLTQDQWTKLQANRKKTIAFGYIPAPEPFPAPK
jgi:Spy/CpxP family protein refolding chaperone